MADTITFRPGPDITIPPGNQSAFVRAAVRFYLELGDPTMGAATLADRYYKRTSPEWVTFYAVAREKLVSLKEILP